MDPASTSTDGARALVTLLREHGVDVVEAPDIAAVEHAARADTLIVVAADGPFVRRKDAASGWPACRAIGLSWHRSSRTREALAPRVDVAEASPFGDGTPDCDLREANRAGEVRFGIAEGV